jgi:hypothetical protein
MIERAARAIAHAVSLQSDSGVTPKWSDFRGEARAAIEAMREPTVAMIEAGAETVPIIFGDTSLARNAWDSMISSALSETSGGEG